MNLLSIGDFARATHLSVKTLRHYDEIGLLPAADVDRHTGYRRYSTRQIPVAQVIRRFRALDMPLGEIQAVLAAPDIDARNNRIAAHLTRLETELGRTQDAVASLRSLLASRQPADFPPVEMRQVEATLAAAITEVVSAEDSVAWLRGALGELYATAAAQDVPVVSHPGGIFAEELFADHRGAVTVFLPTAAPIRAMGRTSALTIPAAELAIICHNGAPTEVDRAYGALAGYVADHALAVDGPIREYYVVNQRDSPQPSSWRTEIGWPIFRVRHESPDQSA